VELARNETRELVTEHHVGAHQPLQWSINRSPSCENIVHQTCNGGVIVMRITSV
jgi:hypothetical protein